MTGKRLKKLYMSQGVPRDTAEFIVKNLVVKRKDDSKLSHQEKYDTLKVMVERIKKK